MLPLLWLSQQTGFKLHQVWWASVISVALQMVVCLALLRREFRRRLNDSQAGAAALS